jgi:hypothetical protein
MVRPADSGGAIFFRPRGGRSPTNQRSIRLPRIANGVTVTTNAGAGIAVDNESALNSGGGASAGKPRPESPWQFAIVRALHQGRASVGIRPIRSSASSSPPRVEHSLPNRPSLSIPGASAEVSRPPGSPCGSAPRKAPISAIQCAEFCRRSWLPALGVMVQQSVPPPKGSCRTIGCTASGWRRSRPEFLARFPGRSVLAHKERTRKDVSTSRDSKKFVMYCLSPRRVRDRPIFMVLTPVFARRRSGSWSGRQRW